MSDRTFRVAAVSTGIALGVTLIVFLWSLWALVNDIREKIDVLDSVVSEIAAVKEVQETALGLLDSISGDQEGVQETALGLLDSISGDQGGADSPPSEPGQPGEPAQPGRPSVSARELWGDFEANQVRATKTYELPRVWAVSGTIDSVGYGEDSYYTYVGLDNVVKVLFRDDYDTGWLDELDKGQHVWFECEVAGQDEDRTVLCVSPLD